MAWFMACDTLAKHPKTLKLARLLGVERRYAVGLLYDLFSWGLCAADKDGRLPGIDAEEIAVALDYPVKKSSIGAPPPVVTALTVSGYLDYDDERDEYLLHNWNEYAGKLYERREKDREKMREYRARNRDT